jgi:hypothetical protein
MPILLYALEWYVDPSILILAAIYLVALFR